MAGLARLASIDDLRARARARMPRFAFDWLDGGAEGEVGLARNSSAFGEIRLQPRYLRDVSAVRTGVTLFGRDYAVPFGICPIAFLNLAWPGTDLALARLAAAQALPMVASTAASTPIERVAEAAEGFAWFQIYVGNDQAFNEMLLGRARVAGCEVLVVTVDVSAAGKRDRDIRHGLQVPFRMTPRILADLALHPRWALGTLRGGIPDFANLVGQLEGFDGPLTIQQQQELMISASFDWDDLARIRDAWPGRVLVKGLMHPGDAVKAVEMGCDGVIVSNHGGRQADYAPASIEVLPEIVAAVAGRAPVMLDSGLRRGADLVRAKALGADFLFAGRLFAYGAAAGGAPGVARAFEILRIELERTLAQIGCPDFSRVDGAVLWRPAPG